LVSLLLIPFSIIKVNANSKIKVKVAIFSNSVDLETAEKLTDFLLNKGYDVSIYEARSFDIIIGLGRADVFIIIGGPQAYEGIGSISSLYLEEEVKKRLVKEKGFYGYWIRDILDEIVLCVVIAGNTRKETKIAEEAYEEKGIEETRLQIAIVLNREISKEEMNALREAGFEVLLFKAGTLMGKASHKSIAEISKLPFVEEVRLLYLSNAKVVLVVICP